MPRRDKKYLGHRLRAAVSPGVLHGERDREPKVGEKSVSFSPELYVVDRSLTARRSRRRATCQNATLFDTLTRRPAHWCVYQSVEGEIRSRCRLPSCRSDDEIQAM